jgi:hypothetical protein
MQLPAELTNEIQTRIERAKNGSGFLSTDRTAVMVDGSIGYGCYISPTGDMFLETYEVGSDEPPTVDRSRCAQHAVLILGSRNVPQLADLLPKRPIDATDCSGCNSSGRTHKEIFRQLGGEGILCQQCCGLGWITSSA